MLGLIGSFICLVISIILRITLQSLAPKFTFLNSWLIWFTVIIIVMAVVCALLIVIAIVKAVRK